MDPDEYPQQWTPTHVKERQAAEDAVAMGVDVYVSALTDQEFNDLVARTRPGSGK